MGKIQVKTTGICRLGLKIKNIKHWQKNAEKACEGQKVLSYTASGNITET